MDNWYHMKLVSHIINTANTVVSSTNGDDWVFMEQYAPQHTQRLIAVKCEYCGTKNKDGGDRKGNCIACGAPLPE